MPLHASAIDVCKTLPNRPLNIMYFEITVSMAGDRRLCSELQLFVILPINVYQVHG